MIGHVLRYYISNYIRYYISTLGGVVEGKICRGSQWLKYIQQISVDAGYKYFIDI